MTKADVDPYKFQRSKRLLTAKDYKDVFLKPKKVSTPELLFLYTNKSNQHSSRLGLAVAKKQIPLAVDRNRIKRLIRESFRIKHNELKSINVVVMVRNKVLKMNNIEIRQQLDILWTKIIHKGEKC